MKRYTQCEIISKTMVKNALPKPIDIVIYAEHTDCRVTARVDPLVDGSTHKGGPGLEGIVVQGIVDLDPVAIWSCDVDFFLRNHFIRRYRVRGEIPVRLTKVFGGLFPFRLFGEVRVCDSLRMAL